jgi:[ribosomal protein S18]-alanine N-acetyltransferase
MSAVFKPTELQQAQEAQEAQMEPMTPAWLATVANLERSAYAYPWTLGNFSDSLSAGYHAQLLTGGALHPTLLGYFVAMKGVDETHLLNITVAPAHQRQGWARVMLDGLAIWSRGQGAQWLWLEVRTSNARAKAIYERYGFRAVGMRKGYYPEGGVGLLGGPAREDAIVMNYKL